MRITLVLADTGRQTPAGLSLLQVGWKATFALPQPDGSITLPEQAVVAFIEAEFAEVNRIHEFDLRLVHEEDEELQQFATGDGLVSSEIHGQILIPQVLGASAGSDSAASLFQQFPVGSLRVSRVPSWYRWEIRIGEQTGRVTFRVNPLPTAPIIGPAAG